MLTKLGKFFKEYLHFGLVILAILVAIVLLVLGKGHYANYVLGFTALASSLPIIWDIYSDLRHGEYGVDILAATAIITSVILGEVWAGIVIVLMLTGGEALEDYAEKRAKTELTSLLEHAPKVAHVYRGRKLIDINVADVKLGDKLLIKPGEVVPVDATVLEGDSSLDESSLTGESLPVDKSKGDQLLSGSVNTDAALTVKALHTAKDSQYEQIIKLVRSATSSRSHFVRLADRYSIPFTIIAFALAGGAWIYSGQVIRFLEVLVVATPCPLILGAPIALISGMSRAAKHGIIVKNGSALERLASSKTMAFDKTGTLTQGQPVVDNVYSFGKHEVSEVLQIAGSLEQHSNHVLAKAIVEHSAKQHLKLIKLKNVRETPGHGLIANFKGRAILVGRQHFIKGQGINLPKKLPAGAQGKTSSLVALGNEVIGLISFTDKIRPESKSTIERIKSSGIKHVLIITGDAKAAAQAIAKKLAISEVVSDCLPADKLTTVEKLPNRPVAFVGDGVNDAPVLTASDVGIALGASGSTAASESADVVVMLDDFSKVADSVQIAKRTIFIAKQSILIGIGLSIGLMFIFATGRFKPVYGAAIQELVDVSVIFNALRAHGSFRHPSTLQPEKSSK